MIPIAELLTIGAGIINKIIPDKEKAAAANLELQKLAQEGQLEEIRSLTRIYEADVNDRKSAREKEAATKDRVPGVLGVFTVLGFFGILWWMMIAPLPDGESYSSILMVLLGALGANSGQVYNYYFGSSMGSTEKNQLLTLFKNKN